MRSSFPLSTRLPSRQVVERHCAERVDSRQTLYLPSDLKRESKAPRHNSASRSAPQRIVYPSALPSVRGFRLGSQRRPGCAVRQSRRWRPSLCFTAAIQSANPRSTIEDRNHQHDLAGVVPNTYWHFRPSRKREQNGDYHKAFNDANFARWRCERLLPNLTAPSRIIMDNASYHRSLPASTPSPTTMRKAVALST